MKKHECLDDEAEWVDENLYHDNWPFLSPEQNRNTDHVRYVRNLWASCVDEKLENPEWNPLAEIRGHTYLRARASSGIAWPRR